MCLQPDVFIFYFLEFLILLFVCSFHYGRICFHSPKMVFSGMFGMCISKLHIHNETEFVPQYFKQNRKLRAISSGWFELVIT